LAQAFGRGLHFASPAPHQLVGAEMRRGICLATCLLAAHGLTAQAAGEADGSNSTCAAGDRSPQCAAAGEGDGMATSFPISLVWPPSRKTAPNLAIVTLAAWSVVVLAILHQESEAEREYQQKRAMQALAQVAQTKYEHAENSRKWARYNERMEIMRGVARQRLAGLKAASPETRETEESLYQQVIVETGFAAEDPPEAALDPRRVFEVLIDEVDDCHVTRIPAVAVRLGPERFGALLEYFEAVQQILIERMLDKLQKTFSKTQAGFLNELDPRYRSFASGTKLSEIVDLAKKVRRHFFPRRAWGMLDAPAADEKGAEFLKTLKDAKALLRDIRRRQPSRMVQILGFFEARTFGYLACACIVRLFGGFIGPARGFLFNLVVTHAADEDWRGPVSYYLSCIAVVFFFDWYVNDWLGMVSTTKATGLLKHALRTQLFSAVLRQDSEYFEANDSSEINRRVKTDCDTVADHAIYIPMDIVGILSSIGWHIALMYQFCPGMLPRTLATGAVIAPLFIGLNKLTEALRKKDARTIRVMHSQTDEMLSKVQAVREFSREQQEASELDRGERILSRSMIMLHIMGHVQHMAIFTLLFGGEVSNYWFGAELVHSGRLDPVKLIQVGGIVYHISFMMKHLLSQVPRFMQILIPAARIFELLESKSLIEPMPGDVRAAFETKAGGIELVFEDVSFAYPLMPEVTVLRHLSLKIPAGKTVAICGERAAGKSTIYKLMQRMYDVEYGQGTIVVNGHPIQHWDVRSYRRALAILAQKGLLFKGTIKENILYGLNEDEKRARGFHLPEGDQELQRLLELSGAWDIVKEFPLKIEQRIGTGGVSLSGGTEQCLFIARGLVKRPAMLMMDEATSAMDTHTQKRAAEGIAGEQARLGFSIVQVAHRIETLTRSDVLYFVEQGKVVEVGGEMSLNARAVDELVARDIVHSEVVNPETGAREEHLTAGFYRHLHEAYYNLDFHKMNLSQLVSKVRTLKEQLERAEAEKEAKMALMLGKLGAPPPVPLDRARTDVPAQCANPQDAAARPREAGGAAAGPCLEAVPEVPPIELGRFSTAPEAVGFERQIS